MNRLNYKDELKIVQQYPDLFRRVGMGFYYRNINISMNKLFFQMISPTEVLIDDNLYHDYDNNSLRLRISMEKHDGLLLLNHRTKKLSDKECEVFYNYNIDIQPNAFVLDKYPDLKYDRVQIMRNSILKSIIND